MSPLAFQRAIDCPCADTPEMGLELCERHFDRIEVRAIRRQEEELGSTLLEDSLGLYALVAGKVVEDHHVALLRRRGELGHRLDPARVPGPRRGPGRSTPAPDPL
jgi:hypothetical protein